MNHRSSGSSEAASAGNIRSGFLGLQIRHRRLTSLQARSKPTRCGYLTPSEAFVLAETLLPHFLYKAWPFLLSFWHDGGYESDSRHIQEPFFMYVVGFRATGQASARMKPE